MTPKEKAEELVLKFRELPQEGTIMFNVAFEISKQCALICCNEVLGYMGSDRGYSFWVEVKQEIELL